MLLQKRFEPIVTYAICIARMTNQGWSGPAFKIDISRRYNKYKLFRHVEERKLRKTNIVFILNCFDKALAMCQVYNFK